MHHSVSPPQPPPRPRSESVVDAPGESVEKLAVSLNALSESHMRICGLLAKRRWRRAAEVEMINELRDITGQMEDLYRTSLGLERMEAREESVWGE